MATLKTYKCRKSNKGVCLNCAMSSKTVLLKEL